MTRVQLCSVAATKLLLLGKTPTHTVSVVRRMGFQPNTTPSNRQLGAATHTLKCGEIGNAAVESCPPERKFLLSSDYYQVQR